MTPIRSKKGLAAVELEQALSHVGKALSLLGGRTRALSVKQNQRIFTVRKYLESVESRLGVCQDLLQIAGAPEGNAADRMLAMLDRLTPEDVEKIKENMKYDSSSPDRVVGIDNPEDFKKEPQNEFEREYDATREPGC